MKMEIEDIEEQEEEQEEECDEKWSPNKWIFRHPAMASTPSRKKGMPEKDELNLRASGIRRIIDLDRIFVRSYGEDGKGFRALVSAATFFHRFFMVHPFQAFSHHVVACSCYFLAVKVQETPRKAVEIASAAKNILLTKKKAELNMSIEDFANEILKHENIILMTLNFELQPLLPFQFINLFCRGLGESLGIERASRIQKRALILFRTSLEGVEVLEWESRSRAAAFVYLALEAEGGGWPDLCGVLDGDVGGEALELIAAMRGRETAPAAPQQVTPYNMPP